MAIEVLLYLKLSRGPLLVLKLVSLVLGIWANTKLLNHVHERSEKPRYKLGPPTVFRVYPLNQTMADLIG
jgi:hypothetical protein